MALDLFCYHRRSSPYFHDIRCLLLGTVTHSKNLAIWNFGYGFNILKDQFFLKNAQTT